MSNIPESSGRISFFYGSITPSKLWLRHLHLDGQIEKAKKSLPTAMLDSDKQE